MCLLEYSLVTHISGQVSQAVKTLWTHRIDTFMNEWLYAPQWNTHTQTHFERTLYQMDVCRGNVCICNQWEYATYVSDFVMRGIKKNCAKTCEWVSECIHYNDGRMHAIWKNMMCLANKTTTKMIPFWAQGQVWSHQLDQVQVWRRGDWWPPGVEGGVAGVSFSFSVSGVNVSRMTLLR